MLWVCVPSTALEKWDAYSDYGLLQTSLFNISIYTYAYIHHVCMKNHEHIPIDVLTQSCTYTQCTSYKLHIIHNTPTHTHACIHTRMHTYTHAYIHIHSYIHTSCIWLYAFFFCEYHIRINYIYIYTYSLLILYIIIYDICIHTLWASCNAMIWWLRWDWGSTWIACPIAFVRNMWSDHCFSSAAGNLTSDNGF